MTLNSGRWDPTVSNVIRNKDETLDPGNVHIDSAKWIQSHANIIHFDIEFTYSPPESGCVESVEFVINFPREFNKIGNLYGWVDFTCNGSADISALNPDAPLTEVRVAMKASANVKKGVIRGVFILR